MFSAQREVLKANDRVSKEIKETRKEGGKIKSMSNIPAGLDSMKRIGALEF